MGKSMMQERRALSARRASWQLAALIAASLSAGPAGAVPGGKLGVLEVGRYTCERPGIAGGEAGIALPELSFRIGNASSYRFEGDNGSYLRLGDEVTMTSGPHKGRKFHRMSDGFLRELGPDGEQTDVRCVIAGR